MSPMRGPRWLLNGHLGSAVSALVDGQLDEETSERAWQHVQTCPPCRRLVENEGWVKRQLGQIAEAPRAEEPSDRFVGALLDLDPAAVAWAETQEIEDSGRYRRRAGIALVGAGSVSAAVLGLTTLSGAPLNIGGSGDRPATSVGRATPSSTPTRTAVAPVASLHGQFRGWRLTPDDAGVTRARIVSNRR